MKPLLISLLAPIMLTPGSLAGPNGADARLFAPAITEYADVCYVDFAACAASDPSDPLLPSGTPTPYHTAWWTFTPVESGYCTIDTLKNAVEVFGKNPDTLLFLHRVVNGNLQFVTYSDDFGPTNHARITTFLTAGTQYYIECATNSSNVPALATVGVLTLRHTPNLNAAYRGFVRAGFDVSQHAYFQLRRTASGLITGKVTIQGKAMPFTTAISADGYASYTFPGSADGLIPPVRMEIDCAGEGNELAVSLTNVGEEGAAGEATLYRELSFSKDNPYAQAGAYTFTHSAFVPMGYGSFTLRVSSNGAATVAGRTGDGAPVTFGSKACATATASRFFPFYRSTFKGKGVFGGELSLTPAAMDTTVTGSCALIRPATNQPPYAGGFNAVRTLTGGRFKLPSAGQRILPSLDPSGLGVLQGLAGDFMAFSTPCTLTTTQALLFPSLVYKPVLKINRRTGLVTGKLIPPNGTVPQKMFGVVQNGIGTSAEIRGSYTGPTRTTAFRLGK